MFFGDFIITHNGDDFKLYICVMVYKPLAKCAIKKELY